MGSYFISELNRSDSILSATVVTDIAALLLLISVLIYTGTYRKRGKFEDRLFFAMIILDMVSAVSDALNSVFEQLNIMELKYSVLRLARGLGGQKSYGLTVSIGGKMGNETGIGTGFMEIQRSDGRQLCLSAAGVFPDVPVLCQDQSCLRKSGLMAFSFSAGMMML